MHGIGYDSTYSSESLVRGAPSYTISQVLHTASIAVGRSINCQVERSIDRYNCLQVPEVWSKLCNQQSCLIICPNIERMGFNGLQIALSNC